MTATGPVGTLDELLAHIGDGARLAVPKDESGVAMAATRALIRRGVKALDLVCVPVGGLQADLLIGAGCVAAIESSAVQLDEFGVGPRFREAVRTASIEIKDSTCPAIHAALQAGEKGIPFMPLRGIIGTDVLANRSDWRVIDNPFGDAEDPVVLLPAINPDIALFHAAWGDRLGNVWTGARRDLAALAHASRATLVTVEEIVEGDLTEDARMAAGTLSAVYVTAIAEAKNGAAPVGLASRYPADTGHMRDYAEHARTAEGFARYLEKFVFSEGAAA